MDEELLLLLYMLFQENLENRFLRRNSLKILRDHSNPFNLDEKVFIKFFRLPKSISMDIIQDLQPFDQQITSIPFVLRFLSVLNFLGHGSYQKCISNNYVVPMSQPSLSRNIAAICDLIIKKKSNVISFPRTVDEIAIKKSGFYFKFGIKGTIGAIDCCHIRIVSPPVLDPVRPANVYMNRKGYHSINMEAICDHELQFLYVNAKFPGSCHDSGIWTTSPIRIHLTQTYNPRKFNWLLGDSGYPLEPWLLTPITAPVTEQEEKFNKIHAKARNTIERAFGVLKTRFRCLHKDRTLHYTPPKAALITYSCVILHNMLIQRGFIEEIQDENNDIENENELPISTEYFNEGRRIRSVYVNSI